MIRIAMCAFSVICQLTSSGCTPRDNIGDQLDGKQVSELCKICFSRAGKESPAKRLEENLLVDVGDNASSVLCHSAAINLAITTMEQNLNIDPLSGGDDSPGSDAKGLDPCSQRRNDSLNTINAESSLSPLKLLRPILLQCSTRVSGNSLKQILFNAFDARGAAGRRLLDWRWIGAELFLMTTNDLGK